jgi:hypothetical protein
VLIVTLLGSGTALAQQEETDLTSLARGAERVVVATVTAVDPVFQTNEYGDRLIVSRTHLRVDAELKKGKALEKSLVMEVEGGTIGDLTLDVSDLPHLSTGERAVVFIARNHRGAIVPHDRGRGILKLDAADRVRGTQMSVASIREAVERAR